MYFRCLAYTPSSKEKFSVNITPFLQVEEEDESDSDSDGEEDTKTKQRV